jgi:hypothetical protein
MQRPWKRRSELNDRIQTVRELHRGTPRQRGYDRDWNHIAKARREADHWLCQPCLGVGCITASNEVDHIVPIHVRPDWRLEFDNTQVICRSCHRKKTIDDARRYGSSESLVINHDQRCARDEALRMVLPPRCAARPVGGGLLEKRFDAIPTREKRARFREFGCRG